MANEVITALFNAQENITQTLQQVESGVEGFENSISELNYELALTEAKSQGTEEQFDSLANASRKLSSHTQTLDRGFDEVRNAMLEIIETGEATDRAMDELGRGLRHLARGSNNTESEVNNLMRSFAELKASGNLTDEQLDRLRDSLVSVAGSGRAASKAANGISQSMIRLYGAATSVENAVNDANTNIRFLGASSAATVPSLKTMNMAMDGLNRDVNELDRSITSLTGDLTVLNAVAGTTALRFSSLSVNIGPFNLALRNILTQLPTIITGMSTTLAVVGSLITAFLTLGAVTGALFAGGALAFMEEFSGQFEDAAQATEALMAALKDLFVDAMAPLMNEANLELFISTINGAARVVNRFAQFANQMRSEVLGTLNEIEIDGEAMFEALHDSFVMMEPILIGFIEFFTQDLPVVLMRFSELTTQISDDLTILVNSLAPLIDQLMSLGATLIHVVAPAAAALLRFMAGFFAFFNSLPGVIKSATVAFGVLGVVVAILVVKMASLAKSIMATHNAMIMQAGGANLLGNSYKALLDELALYAAGNQSLRDSLAATRAEIAANISAWATQKQAYLLNTAASNMWTGAAAVQLGILSELVSGNITFSQALNLTAANIWRTVTSLYAKATAAWAAAGGLSGVATQAGVLIAELTILALQAVGKAIIAFITLGAKALMLVGRFLLLSVKSIPSAVAGMKTMIVTSLSLAATILNTVATSLAVLIADFFSVGTAASTSSVGVWAFAGSVNATITPVYLLMGAIAAVIGIFVLLADVIFGLGIFDWIMEKIQWVLGGIADLMGSLIGVIPGFGGDMKTKVETQDDIQTDANVNLNFEDKLEQNMEVNADPEEKEQMRRVVEDAMNEANSIARRQQGVGR